MAKQVQQFALTLAGRGQHVVHLVQDQHAAADLAQQPRTMTKILLVEDHEELWDLLSRRLRRHGFEVALARDGRQALDQVAAEMPDLVLLDMDHRSWTA